MSGIGSLIEEIASTLWAEVKAYDIPKVAASFGMEAGAEDEAFGCKRAYVVRWLAGWSEPELLDLAKKVEATYPSDSLQQIIETFDPHLQYPISSVTRQHLLSCMDTFPNIQGKLELIAFLEKLWSLRTMRSSGFDLRCITAYDEVCQHMIVNDDYSFVQMLKHLNLIEMSNRKLAELLEWSVHPLVRVDSEQQLLVDSYNEHLKHDGLALLAADQEAGYPVFRVTKSIDGVSGSAKNLIFASNGPKPEIVLADAINNDIRIVKNAEHCLVYDRPFNKDGLLWSNLVKWWAEHIGTSQDINAERTLYSRLFESLASPPERLLFRDYFKIFKPLLGERFPVLVPQVYLHYDPYTIAQLRHDRRLSRQRMDFLMLLSPVERMVIEVDGKQHYSDGDLSSPSKYSEMVKSDRELRLLGYEVYRFGGTELSEAACGSTVTTFFTNLFRKHNVRRPDGSAAHEGPS